MKLIIGAFGYLVIVMICFAVFKQIAIKQGWRRPDNASVVDDRCMWAALIFGAFAGPTVVLAAVIMLVWRALKAFSGPVYRPDPGYIHQRRS